MSTWRRVIPPRKTALNPSFTIGGLDPDEIGHREWIAGPDSRTDPDNPGDGDCLISSKFSRLDSRLENDQIPIRPFPDHEKLVYPRPNPKRTAELNLMIRQLAHRQ